MTGLDIFTFIVLGVLLGVTIALALLLGGLPGKIASQRGHPQVDAIRVAGWLGLLTLGLLWPFALIWAFTRPGPLGPEASSDELDQLRQRVTALENAQSAAGGKEAGS